MIPLIAARNSREPDIGVSGTLHGEPGYDQVTNDDLWPWPEEARIKADPWFDGDTFHLVDAAYGPVFRYFDVFDEIEDFGILKGRPKIARWRNALRARPSVAAAVKPDYPARLKEFTAKRPSHLAGLLTETV